jgi:hypothetical protein
MTTWYILFRIDDQDIIVDDLPINNIRKLVARQMSMSIQLVIQVYLPAGAVRWFYTHLYSYIHICDHLMFNVIINVRMGSHLDVLSCARIIYSYPICKKSCHM